MDRYATCRKLASDRSNVPAATTTRSTVYTSRNGLVRVEAVSLSSTTPRHYEVKRAGAYGAPEVFRSMADAMVACDRMAVSL